MTIQERVTLYILPILAFAFLLIVVAMQGLPGSVDAQIDEELNALGLEMSRYNSERDRVLREWEWPDAGIKTAASFYIIFDQNEGWLTQSPNVPAAVTQLAAIPPLGETCDPQGEERQIGSETIRVLTWPVCGDKDDATTLIGYLQVGHLVSDYVYYRELTQAVVFIVGASLFGALAALGLIMPRILKPLTRISDVAGQITSADDLSRRIDEPKAKDQISRLVRVLNKLMERLEQLFRTQQRLLGDVSHELRTPLTAIRGNVDVIRRTGIADPDSLEAIDAEAQRMSRLVDDLLTLARAEGGGLPINRAVVDIDHTILQVYEQMMFLDSPVRVILGDLAHEVQVLGDEDRLKQLFINLMTNGIKYTNPGGQVRVSLHVENGYAAVRVQDTGLGIPADDLPHIFDRFYRVNKARTRERGGAGLGLSIVKSIVDAHDGEITVESVVGEGSTFTVRLPLIK